MKTLFLISFTLTASIVMAQNPPTANFALIKGGPFKIGSPATELERTTKDTLHEEVVWLGAEGKTNNLAMKLAS